MVGTPSGGGIALDVKIRFDVAELGSWPADRIAALFNGLGIVIAAQNAGKGTDADED